VSPNCLGEKSGTFTIDVEGPLLAFASGLISAVARISKIAIRGYAETSRIDFEKLAEGRA
jgi:hypothetical protein